jgi:cytochrome c nitrite reductase small subunit
MKRTAAGSAVQRLSTRGGRVLSWVAAAAAIGLGLFGGLGAYTFNFAQGLSYFSNDPRSCVNCHVMNDAYDSWQKSGHGHVAVCNDCHTPHSFVGKMITKAENGWNHSVAFTMLKYEREPIVITERNADRLRHNCIACHDTMLTEIRGSAVLSAAGHGQGSEDVDCLHCHSDVGHGARR